MMPRAAPGCSCAARFGRGGAGPRRSRRDRGPCRLRTGDGGAVRAATPRLRTLGPAELELTVDPARAGSEPDPLYLFDATVGRPVQPVRRNSKLAHRARRFDRARCRLTRRLGAGSLHRSRAHCSAWPATGARRRPARLGLRRLRGPGRRCRSGDLRRIANGREPTALGLLILPLLASVATRTRTALHRAGPLPAPAASSAAIRGTAAGRWPAEALPAPPWPTSSLSPSSLPPRRLLLAMRSPAGPSSSAAAATRRSPSGANR